MQRALRQNHVFCLGGTNQPTRWTATAITLCTIRPRWPYCVWHRGAGENNNNKIVYQVEIYGMEKPLDTRCADVNNPQDSVRFDDLPS